MMVKEEIIGILCCMSAAFRRSMIRVLELVYVYPKFVVCLEYINPRDCNVYTSKYGDHCKF